MPKFKIEIIINAPREIVFDLARSIDFHKESTKHTKEEAIAGKTFGLLELDESVTWRAKHFGVWLELESKITPAPAKLCLVAITVRKTRNHNVKVVVFMDF